MAVRCFLHFRHGGDDNALSWEAQDEAAARKIGAADSADLTPAIGCGFISACTRRATRSDAVAEEIRRRGLRCAGNSRLADAAIESDFSVVDG